MPKHWKNLENNKIEYIMKTNGLDHYNGEE